MRTIQIRFPERLVEKAQELVNLGLYSNKSDVIRDSLRRLCFPQVPLTKKKFKIIFTSDIHGNSKQYKKLFNRANFTKTNAVIIGGDLSPKDKKNRTPKKQEKFLKEVLLPLIQKFHKKNKQSNHYCKIFMMLGNDDFKKNLKILKRNEKDGEYKVIQNKCLPFYKDFKIIGYSYVPLTPFLFKDWEKLDLIKEKEEKREDFIIEGVINNSIKKKFDLSNRKDTIEEDLNKLTENINPKKLILVTHTPPHNTSLDRISKDRHVGSQGVKRIIEKKQPFITLHGHIHETVKLSNQFFEKIKNTISITSGNDYLSSKLAIIEFNLNHPEIAKRTLI